jgi:hypothetical protein
MSEQRFEWAAEDVVWDDEPEPAAPLLPDDAVKRFDPHEARDRHGRWTNEGRGGGGATAKVGKNWLGHPMRESGIHRRGFDPTPAVMLVTTGQPDMDRFASGSLGRLLVPGSSSAAKATEADGVPFAVDNGGFFGVPEAKYKAMLEKLAKDRVHPLWVTVPDVIHHLPDGTIVGDADATIKRFEQWQPYLKHLGLPAAFVAQNGMDEPGNMAWLDKHWDDIEALFIGGNDDFKLSPSAAKLTKLAHDHGKLVHIGRVNTAMRIAYARDVLQADSFDGSQWAKWKDNKLPKGLAYTPTGDAPPTAIGRKWVQAAAEARDTGGPWPRPPTVTAPQWPHGFYPDPVKAVGQGGVVYMQPLADALYAVGLSDYVHLIFDPDQVGFSIAYDNDAQLDLFVRILGLPAPTFYRGLATWANVLVKPDDRDEDPDVPEVKRFDPRERRDEHGRWTDTPDLPDNWQALSDADLTEALAPQDVTEAEVDALVTYIQEGTADGGVIEGLLARTPPLPRDVTVYRAGPIGQRDFYSTTFDRQHAAWFDFAGPTRQMTIPAGRRALSMRGELGDLEEQDELLVAKGDPPTFWEVFDSWPREKQDDLFGTLWADKLRDGTAGLDDPIVQQVISETRELAGIAELQGEGDSEPEPRAADFGLHRPAHGLNVIADTVVPVESWEQAADAMLREHARGNTDVRVRIQGARRSDERDLTADEARKLIELATARAGRGVKFDPHEARDSHGRWARGPGSRLSGAEPKAAAIFDTLYNALEETRTDDDVEAATAHVQRELRPKLHAIPVGESTTFDVPSSHSEIGSVRISRPGEDDFSLGATPRRTAGSSPTPPHRTASQPVSVPS